MVDYELFCRRVLEFLNGTPGRPGNEIAKKLGLSLAVVNPLLRQMAREKRLVETTVVAKRDSQGALQYGDRKEMKRVPGGSIVWAHPDHCE